MVPAVKRYLALVLAVVTIWTVPGVAIAIDSWSTWSAAQPQASRQLPVAALAARGEGTNAYYVLEVDPATGALPVSGTFTPTYAGATGAAVPADAAFMGGSDGGTLRGVKVDADGELQVDVVSSALPSGAATAARQDTGNTSLATLAGAVSGTEVQVDVLTSALPTGAATAANQTTANTSLASIDGKLDEGQETMANGLAVTIASDQTQPVGRAYGDSIRNAYASTNVTTGAWVELDASTAAAINAISVFDSCGETLELGTGAAAAETRVLLIPPGGPDGVLPLRIASGTRVAIRAVSGNCTTGEFVLTGFN